MRYEPMRYEDVSEVLPALADGSEPIDPAVARFVASNLRAQAELVRYRRLLRALAQLREHLAAPPPDLLDRVLDALEHEGERRLARVLTGRRIAVASAIGGAAVAAGATAAAVLVVRSRRKLKLAS